MLLDVRESDGSFPFFGCYAPHLVRAEKKFFSDTASVPYPNVVVALSLLSPDYKNYNVIINVRHQIHVAKL